MKAPTGLTNDFLFAPKASPATPQRASAQEQGQHSKEGPIKWFSRQRSWPGKPSHLSSILESHGGRRKVIPQSCPHPPQACSPMHTYTDTHAHMHTLPDSPPLIPSFVWDSKLITQAILNIFTELSQPWCQSNVND